MNFARKKSVASIHMLSKARLKKFSWLKKKKRRWLTKLFLVEGWRSCHEALTSDFVVETLLFHSPADRENISTLIELAQKKGCEIFEISATEAKALSDTIHAQGVFCVVRQRQIAEESLLASEPDFMVLVDAGQDPGNVGALIRTCDWFGVQAVILSQGNVDLYNSKVLRATMGSIFHLPIIENVKLDLFLSEIKKRGYHIFAADVAAKTPYLKIDFKKPVALILGNENRGISQPTLQLVDTTICIPAFGLAESLNVAAAGAVLISHLRLKLSLG